MLLNRYDAIKILLILETAPIEQYPEYQSREEALKYLRFDRAAIGKLPKQRIITLDVDSICDCTDEIELCFSSMLNEMTDTNIKHLAADVLKDISEIDKQHMRLYGIFPPNSEECAITDFTFRSHCDVEVGCVDGECGSEYSFPLKKEGSTWCIDLLKYHHRKHQPASQ
jgi:hypothetical protein